MTRRISTPTPEPMMYQIKKRIPLNGSLSTIFTPLRSTLPLSYAPGRSGPGMDGANLLSAFRPRMNPFVIARFV